MPHVKQTPAGTFAVIWSEGGVRRHATLPTRAEADEFAATKPGQPPGSRIAARGPGGESDVDRVLRLVIQDPEMGCWIWQAYKHLREGYGQVSVNGTVTTAHRYSYETFAGPIPAGLHLDHLCRVRACVNPGHLEPVTSRENVMRSTITRAYINASKTECAQGHPYNEANTYHWRGNRICRACRRDQRRRLTTSRRAA